MGIQNQASDRKMKELVLYLASRSEDDPRFSSTKLNKLLFYCDFSAYRDLGEPITGHSYQKLPFGPAPKSMLPILSRMKDDGDCTEVERDRFGLQQKRVVALRSPDLSVFSGAELELADRILRNLWESSASEVSDLSHELPGWRAAAFQEVIPYETIFVGDPSMPVSDDEIEFCRQLEGRV
jgi:hypothetical protein